MLHACRISVKKIAVFSRSISSFARSTNPKHPRITKTCALRNGTEELHFDIGQIGLLADGAALVRYGKSVLLATAVSAREERDTDFLPLEVDYRERASGAGRIPATYFRRELLPSEKETLTSRLVDRSLRPLFPKQYYMPTQIILSVLAADGQNDPDVQAINAASACLMISDIPWEGPVAAVRMGRVEGQLVVNPTHDELEQSDLNLVLAGTRSHVIMIEALAKNIADADFTAALHVAHNEIQPIISALEEIGQSRLIPKRRAEQMVPSDALLQAARDALWERLTAIYSNRFLSKGDRDTMQESVGEEAIAELQKRFHDEQDIADKAELAVQILQRECFRELVWNHGIRCDGRGIDEVRPITAAVDILPVVHGSSLFQRGDTQCMSIATLAMPDMIQSLDAITGGPESKHFFLHYDFPPFAINEVSRLGRANRREIGHGALAEKAIRSVLPSYDHFPYVIRLNANVTMSAGSTSMAAVCAGCLALMDAGVPISQPVASLPPHHTAPPPRRGRDG